MSDSLTEYERKRDFEATPEPAPAKPSGRTPDNRFVIQQHSATRLHWDLRLERDGVLLSWALPRGVPWDPKQNHLAVHTEDHPLEYLTFAGDIPEGSYGAGSMFVWDTGTYEAHEFEDRKLVVTLRGARARGKYALFATRGKDWMIHRMDPPDDPDRRLPPDDLRPMQPEPGALPTGDGWAFEVRWTGLRCLVMNQPGLTLITNDSGEDMSASFPEVRRIGRAIGATEVVLDGVITGDGIERRLEAKSDSTVRRLARDMPVAFVAFDAIWWEGHAIWDEPWSARRERLDSLDLGGEAWQAPAAHVGDGAALLEAARANGLGGLIAKKTGARYRCGVVSPDWRAVAV